MGFSNISDFFKKLKNVILVKNQNCNCPVHFVLYFFGQSHLSITIILILGDDQMLIQGTTTSGSIRSRTPIDERIRIANIAEEVKKSKLADVQDLIHLQHPLSEDLVLRTLQARYFKYFLKFSFTDTRLYLS